MMNAPKDVANNCVGIGKGKAGMCNSRLFVLGILAGMFIALAATAANTASSTIENASVSKLVGACVFPGGLAMVLLAGSELFTGNTMVIPFACAGKVSSVKHLLRNWAVVYIGNFVGSMIIVLLVNWGGQLNLFGGALAVTTMKVAAAKASLAFPKAICLGILCNFLVCIAVWISFAAKTVGGKIAGLFFPIMMFVLSGFEHSVANMYYVPSGLVALASGNYAEGAATIANIGNLTWGNFLVNNLIPVTIGNIIGGTVFVAGFYWFVYIRKTKAEKAAEQATEKA